MAHEREDGAGSGGTPLEGPSGVREALRGGDEPWRGEWRRRGPAGEQREVEAWFQRFRAQLEWTAQRCARREAERQALLHQLDALGRSPAEVDTPERVAQRLQRLGIAPGRGEAQRRGSVQELRQVVPRTSEPGYLVLERMLGRSDLTSICFLERGLRAARTVGRVRLHDERGKLRGYGTGFLVSPRLLLTNHHVLGGVAEAAASEVEFNYQAGVDGAALPSLIYPLEPASLFLTDEALDYTLVAVRETAANGTPLCDMGYNPLTDTPGEILLGEAVNIIQHPDGEPKQVSLRENRVVDVLEDFCHYVTRAAPGSSGAPIYNEQWEVVALHHGGVPEGRDGRYLTVDGKDWTPHLGEHRLAWRIGEGTRLRSILRHIRAQRLTGEAARLQTGLLDGYLRLSLPRTPPRVMPPMSPADMGRAVRQRALSPRAWRERPGEED